MTKIKDNKQEKEDPYSIKGSVCFPKKKRKRYRYIKDNTTQGTRYYGRHAGW